ncbi:MAG: hypothetical protein KI790_10580 [Cyclobacteriaceae bacterium]|nr:hypothetical protein [Cyclobacteriaceae bacterium HetDA_MAG_MS6]
MKRIAFIMTLVLAAAFTACDQSGDEIVSDALDIDLEETIESSFEDIDVISDEGMDDLAIDGRRRRFHVLDCAVIEHDTVEQVITIDYGDGCEGRNGRVRKGKIIIQYDGRRNEPGSYRIVTLEDFFIDSTQIEGTRTVTNISVDTDDNPTFNIKLEGGKLTFADGTFATREADHTRTWFRFEEPEDDYSTLDGSASGVNREGLDYSAVITETITFKRSCRNGRVFVPVSGQKVYTVGDRESIINYGDGTCDNLVTITTDGVTEERALRLRGRR